MRRRARARKNVSYARSLRRLNFGFAGPTRRNSSAGPLPSRRALSVIRPLERSRLGFQVGTFASAMVQCLGRHPKWRAMSGWRRSARRRTSGSGPERRVRLSCPGYCRTSTFHGPRCTCGQRPSSSASAGLTARRLIDARCPARPGGNTRRRSRGRTWFARNVAVGCVVRAGQLHQHTPCWRRCDWPTLGVRLGRGKHQARQSLKDLVCMERSSGLWLSMRAKFVN